MHAACGMHANMASTTCLSSAEKAKADAAEHARLLELQRNAEHEACASVLMHCHVCAHMHAHANADECPHAHMRLAHTWAGTLGTGGTAPSTAGTADAHMIACK